MRAPAGQDTGGPPEGGELRVPLPRLLRPKVRHRVRRTLLPGSLQQKLNLKIDRGKK